ncbi:MAG: hypothetical protein V3S72_01065, partial [Desulfobacterales bacterium]
MSLCLGGGKTIFSHNKMDIAAFSDEQLAGQLLMVGFDGTELNQDLMFLIDTLKVGGIILFA